MFLESTGFPGDDTDDDSIKLEMDVRPEFEHAVMEILGRTSLAAEGDGEQRLTEEQVKVISTVIHEQLPAGLKLYIGVRT